MGKKELQNHWNYYLVLEKDFIKLKDYIYLSEDNYTIYSFELAKVLQLTCSEIDTVFKLLCKQVENDKKRGSIADYKAIILNKFKKIIDVEIQVDDLGKSIKPFERWDEGKLFWWDAYANLKHNRHQNFKEANLKNVIYSMTALLVLNIYLHRLITNKEKGFPHKMTACFDSKYLTPYLICSASEELPDFKN